MKKTLFYALSLAGVLALTRCAYSKHCYGNGVCKVVENGQERFEGSPEAVAQHLNEEKAQKQASADLQKRYDNAPRRGAGAKSRVAIFIPRGTTDELAQLSGEYYKMIAEHFASDSEIELIGQNLVEPVLEKAINPHGFHSTFEKIEPSSQEVVTRMRDQGLFADVVVFTELRPKQFLGYVSNNGAHGLVELQHVEFVGKVTSVYSYKTYELKAEGKSSNQLAVAGLSKDRKFSNGSMNFKRDTNSDLPAVKDFVAQVKAAIKKDIAPQLPTVAAVEEIQGNRAVSSEALKSVDFLQNLFGPKK